jgi:DNA-binding Lrp family transcriptional regulator
VTGAYDLIVLVEAENMSVLTDTVMEKIHDIEGVTDTTTAIVVG